MPTNPNDPAPSSLKRRIGRSASRGAKVRLNQHDLWCLEGVAKFRFLPTDQLVSLYFPHAPHYAVKRLRRLLDAGLIRVFVRSLATANIYCITREGLRRLEQASIALPQGTKAPGALDGNLDHTLAINAVRCAMAKGLQTIAGELSWWSSDWELTRKRKSSLAPDALFCIQWDWGGEQVYALELENATRSPRAFTKKIVKYKTLRAQSGGIMGYANVIVLVVGARPRQLKRYREVAEVWNPTPWMWFAHARSLTPEGLSALIWQPPDQSENLSLRDLSYLSLP